MEALTPPPPDELGTPTKGGAESGGALLTAGPGADRGVARSESFGGEVKREGTLMLVIQFVRCL